MKNTENAAIPMSGRRYVVFNPRRLSGNWSKQLRNEASRASSTRTRVKNRISRSLGILHRAAAPCSNTNCGILDSLCQTIPVQTRFNRIENCCEQAAGIAHRVLAVYALPVRHRRTRDEARPEQVRPQHGDHQSLIACLAVA